MTRARQAASGKLRHQCRERPGHLDNVRNIYAETSERAYAIARQVDRPEAQAIFLSGVGMPTLDALQPLEEDTGKAGDLCRRPP